MKVIMAVLCLLLVVSCSAVTIRTDENQEASHGPSFQKRYAYYWWGLKGEHSINVREVCAGKPVRQMQAVYTIKDFGLALITFGVYVPRTARIWCAENDGK